MKKFFKFSTTFLVLLALAFSFNLVPVKAAAVISAVEFVNPENGGYYYTGEIITIKATASGFTQLRADFSDVEGNAHGTNMEASIDNGDGTYTFSHTVINTTAFAAKAIAVMAFEGPVPTVINTDLTVVLNVEPREIMLDQKDAQGNFVSETTVWKDIADVRAAAGLTFDVPGKGKVVFTKALDLTDSSLITFLQGLDSYMQAFVGSLKFDASVVEQMRAAGAQITLYGLPYEKLPLITIDGVEATASDISGISYDAKTGTLVFDAAHFSTFAALTKVTVTSPKIKAKKKTKVAGAGLLLKGTASDYQAKLTIKVNGKTQKKNLKVSKKGKFQYNIKLKKGKNIVKISAKNSIGTSEKTITIYRTK